MANRFRIVSWNCNGALRTKLDALDSLQADLLVIQECEDPKRSSAHYRDWAGDYQWTGDNKNKGLGVFAKCAQPLERLGWYGSYSTPTLFSDSAAHHWCTEDLKLFLPVTLGDLTLLAVWTKGTDKQAFGYVGQLWKYLHIHHPELSQPRTMLVGDLNSNTIWDQADRWWNHSDVVAALKNLGLESLYHTQQREPQGQESTPTFYMHRNLNKPYHIDYAFLSEDLQAQSRVDVGDPVNWLQYSDHMPLLIDVEVKSTTQGIGKYKQWGARCRLI
ncbi:MAG: endonuclease/exonuclease/phosphatase family protein [Oceanospirillales bacterium]|nr:endonuclease/exonuclease/phosphatase family protein [Oceanospirillales bacterium]